MHSTTGLLSDHRHRPRSISIQDWLRAKWIPRAIRGAGYSHCAIIESSKPIGRLAARTVDMATGSLPYQPLLQYSRASRGMAAAVCYSSSVIVLTAAK
jgi:hypothetical protein